MLDEESTEKPEESAEEPEESAEEPRDDGEGRRPILGKRASMAQRGRFPQAG